MEPLLWIALTQQCKVEHSFSTLRHRLAVVVELNHLMLELLSWNFLRYLGSAIAGLLSLVSYVPHESVQLSVANPRFGHLKTRYKGIEKNSCTLDVCLALANLAMCIFCRQVAPLGSQSRLICLRVSAGYGAWGRMAAPARAGWASFPAFPACRPRKAVWLVPSGTS